MPKKNQSENILSVFQLLYITLLKWKTQQNTHQC